MTTKPASLPPVERSEVIQLSLRCFTLGLLGLLPVLGAPFAIAALSSFFRVKQIVGTQWNPAGDYLTWGLATALSGVFLTLIAGAVIAIIMVEKLV